MINNSRIAVKACLIMEKNLVLNIALQVLPSFCALYQLMTKSVPCLTIVNIRHSRSVSRSGLASVKHR